MKKLISIVLLLTGFISYAQQGFIDSMRTHLQREFAGDTSIVVMAGTIRNTCGPGTTIKWEFLNNTDHLKMNFDSAIAYNTNDIKVFFPAGTKCLTFIAVPDESMLGYSIGSSFSLDYALIRLRKLVNQSSAIWFNGVGHGIAIYGNTTPGISYDTTTGKFTVNCMNWDGVTNNPNYNISLTSASPDFYPVIDGWGSYGQISKIYFYIYDRITNQKITGTKDLQPIVHVSAMPYWALEVVNNTVGSGLGCGGNTNIWLLALLKKY